jgi:uncharacterized protein (TIGR01777 family)
MRRVIITGGTGLIGRALAAHLAPAGYEVILLSRAPGLARDLPAGVRAVEWDARSAAGWGELADGATAIVNLAGESIGGGRWTAERKRRIRDSRLNAGAAVVQAIKLAERKPEVVIQASGIGIYGNAGDAELTEDAPAGRDWLSRLAVEWEEATASIEPLGVRRVVTRNGVVLSMKAIAFQRLLLPFRFFAGGRLGNGRQWMSWIHIDDMVRALRFLIETSEARGAFNLCAPAPVRNADLARAIGRVMRRPAFQPVPALVLRLLFGEMAGVLLDSQRATPRRLLALGFTFQYPEVESALRALLKGA